MPEGPDPRVLAARVLVAVAHAGRSLGTELPRHTAGLGDERDRRLTADLVYGVLRGYWRFRALVRRRLRQPLRARDADLEALLLVGAYQLLDSRTPAHAAVSSAVASTRTLGKPWASGLVNAVLRGLAGDAAEAADALRDPEARWSHPAWLIDALRAAWPGHWQAILEAGNTRAPMTLRVNLRRTGRDAYQHELARTGIEAAALPDLPAALTLARPLDVRALPGFAEGLVSVQDAAAQLAAPLLAPRPGERVLDACAAPGGKTAHLLELCPGLGELVALDEDAGRLERVGETLDRLGLRATVVLGDASEPARWWDGRPFDAILLDAPCSATGVIRRHPDIKLLRRADDLPRLAARQRLLLAALWPLLAPGGRLLYATCSVLPQENADCVNDFIAAQNDAFLQQLPVPWALDTGAGCQILPGTRDMDGFFYARLLKR